VNLVDHLCLHSGQLFGKRGAILSLWQTIADNFYPERADFTAQRNIGDEFASELMSSYPVMARRDLGNAFGAMLRPTSKNWMHIRTRDNWEKIGVEGRQWLEEQEAKMKRAMYHRESMFTRATKEADHDFATFGQSVIQVSLNRKGNGLLYRCWHLRDVAWAEDEAGGANSVFRKWMPTAQDLSVYFPKTIHPKIKETLARKPYETHETRHCIIPSDVYNRCEGIEKEIHTPFVSCYFDPVNQWLLECVGLKSQEYMIPRWQTVSGSQYAYSPASIVALPDARLIQAMTRVLLEAGEKAVTPPMVAVQDAIRSDVSVYAGGITYVAEEYDERMGEVLRPLTQDKNGIPLGLEMAQDTRAMIAECFYLNKISLPQPGNEMTAYEVGQRVQEYIRQAMPLFEPMESEYNGPLCDLTFEIMLRAGAFGSPQDIPKELQGHDIEFTFESPLHDAIEREKGQRFLEAKGILADAAAIDQGVVNIIDVVEAVSDVFKGLGVPAKWQRTPGQAKEIAAQRAQAQQTSQLLANMQQGADVAKTLGEAAKNSPAVPGDSLGGVAAT
jgi:hypothetical protein